MICYIAMDTEYTHLIEPLWTLDACERFALHSAWLIITAQEISVIVTLGHKKKWFALSSDSRTQGNVSVKICPGRGFNELLKAQMMQGQEDNISVIQAKQRGDEANKSVKGWTFFQALQRFKQANDRGCEAQIKYKLQRQEHSEHCTDRRVT